MINTSADSNAAYMNFLRCVTAIATASAGTTSLTVNPFTNNTGTIDNTKNCIVKIIANTEAGGWTTSASHNVVNSGSFTAIQSATGGLYKADFYNSSGKGTYPFDKLSFHTLSASTSKGNYWYTTSYNANYNSNFTNYPFVAMTYGCHTVSDWSVTAGYVPGNSATLANEFNVNRNSNQSTSWTLHGEASTQGWSNDSNNTHPYNVKQTDVTYFMAVTANYCIIWTQNTNNSYNNGYSNTLVTPNNSNWTKYYGNLTYMGLRETQPWENARADNPPWVVFSVSHTKDPQSTPGQYPVPKDEMACFMATYNDSSVQSSTAMIYYYYNTYSQSLYIGNGVSWATMSASLHYGPQNNYSLISSTTPTSLSNAGYLNGLVPIFGSGRDFTASSSYGLTPSFIAQSFMPSVDPVTGTGVPSAYPIMIRRVNSGGWNPGGAVRGLYKSMNMPLATMKNYFADGQLFQIPNSSGTYDLYMPIVFNETMYLVRYA